MLSLQVVRLNLTEEAMEKEHRKQLKRRQAAAAEAKRKRNNSSSRRGSNANNGIEVARANS